MEGGINELKAHDTLNNVYKVNALLILFYQRYSGRIVFDLMD